jgi:hypothetical protein
VVVAQGSITQSGRSPWSISTVPAPKGMHLPDQPIQ